MSYGTVSIKAATLAVESKMAPYVGWQKAPPVVRGTQNNSGENEQ